MSIPKYAAIDYTTMQRFVDELDEMIANLEQSKFALQALRKELRIRMPQTIVDKSQICQLGNYMGVLKQMNE